MKATYLSSFSRVEETELKKKTDDHDFVLHDLEGYEVVQPYKFVESTSYEQTINCVTEEPGFYRIVFSNYYSWLRGKELLWRYCVLTPTVDTSDLKKDRANSFGEPESEPLRKSNVYVAPDILI